MTRLYDLTENYKNIAALLDDETMDMEIISTALATINGSIAEKCASISGLIKDFDADAAAIRAEEKRLADRRRAIENRRDWLKGYIQENMERMELDKIKTPLFTFTLAKNPPALIIINRELIPAKYLTIIPEHTEPNKEAIKMALKDGQDIPGTMLTIGKSLRIR